ncbi:MAG TPA: serine/threonine protein kinase [Cyanobacteria bacterium UBA11149]|nr:serine/threonine protein kinase [Cyanobacteria bacterium UBA11367]HBE59627.1 serine/threonine protein kinase [Cyanobacteria bacterium UBA11366]HBK64473.1 serine/threonine protein kinase [Cyanobacteria bacterium UBA11166]HBR75455.1 serine/threonine protein kinase [Cyanobacteria bacterium UBA11159]HBS70003.1 serine/threonine protein kinase [Cyanobacteria bacterium UBA11153]HBW90053.1 serine/threonine protein kinase [Cyanobacteria bacterium UBA11149]HCA94112.1 serine/threonine protein kinase 
MVWKAGKQLNGNRYTIERILGRGSWAITYLAWDSQGNRLVIKTLSDEILLQLQATPDEIKKLQDKLFQEATKLAQCQHPHVVKCLGQPFRERDGNQEFVCVPMEYIAGVDLASLPQRQLLEAEALRYIRQIGEALVCVHSQGLLHRDVKPTNILVRQGKGEAVLIDFDLARENNTLMSSRGHISDGFAPPELYLSSLNIDVRSDIYSLAATLYVLLTGEIPPKAENRQLNPHQYRLIPPKEINPHVSDRVNDAIIQGMSLEADARPADIQAWLGLLGICDRGNIWLERLKRHWLVVVGIIGFLAALAGFLNDGMGVIDRFFPPHNPPPPTESGK